MLHPVTYLYKMNLGKQIVKNLLSEIDSPIKTIVAIYPGRFQPMGKHHAKVYDWLAGQFGKSNTYIATSDKVALPKSPLNFKEKFQVIKKHGITNVSQEKNVYAPENILKKYNPETTAVVFVYGKKDAGRLRYTKKDGTPGYFQEYEKSKGNLKGYETHGYVVIAPHIELKIPGFGEMSGTTLRAALATADMKTFKDIMGWYDSKLHELLKIKFSQVIESFLIERSSIGGSKAMVDDGPRYYYGNQKTYRKKTAEMAKRLGFEVINYILKDNPIEVHDTNFPDGPPLTVSYFPTGVKGGDFAGTDYIKDYKGRPGYAKWKKYTSKVAQQVGYKFLNFLGAEDSIESSKSEELKPTGLFEDINLPINIGDKIMMGRFKNKPVIVKSINFNEKGDLLINGRSAARFRIVPQEQELTKEWWTNTFKEVISEIGDLSAGFYDVTGPLPEAGGKRYTKYKFTTDSGLRYDVVFYYTRADIEVWFETYGNVKPEDPQFSGDKLDMSKTTDRGELYKVMATTFGIINHYLTAKDAGKMFGKHNDGLSPFEMHLYANTDNPPPHPMLRIEPTKEKDQTGGDRDSDKRREKLYLQYFKKQGYKATLVGSTILVDVKEYLNEVDYHSKLSRGHKPDWYQLGTSDFKPFDEKDLNEAKANTHLTHLEELILTQGEAGYKQAKSFIIELLKNLAGSSNTKVNTSVKWDGAPAIFTGINPDNGQFFVGTKSVFNKVPKINYTMEDIDMNHGQAPGLAEKLKLALQYFPSLGIKNILQGDFMFDSSMIKSTNIDGKSHISFRPNTITYAVESDSDLGKQIAAAKIGIVFHTTYESLTSGAQFGADVSGLNQNRNVWFDDAFFKDTTGVVTLTVSEAREVQSLIKKADSIKVNYDNLPAADLNIYLNNEIRSGQFVNNPKVSFKAFQKWYQAKIDKRVAKLKSEKGKAKAIAAGQEQISMFQSRQQDIINLFKLSKLLSDAKLIFVKKYNNAIYNTKHFVDDGKGGLRVTAPEGYVAVDRIGNGVKFVDRVEFSRANFAMDKGFTK